MGRFYRLTAILLISARISGQGTFTAAITTNATKFCTGREIAFSVSASSEPLKYTWSVFPDRSVILPSPGSPTVSMNFATALNYTVSVVVTSDTETVTASRVISVSRSALASFNASLSDAGYPTRLDLTNYSTNITDSYWLFNDGSVDSSFNATRYFNSSGSHKVTLFALGKNGCDDTLDYSFRISDSSSVVIPNVFTPNYDGVNDVYMPLVRGISNLNVWIYNRDGVLVSTWNKVNGYWDGHTTGGEECNQGSYFVVLDAVGFDGRNYKLKGNFILLR
jgi:gliding motility-associated-like protein